MKTLMGWANVERVSSWQVRSARLFDMFPNTDHAEVVVLLEPRTGTLGA